MVQHAMRVISPATKASYPKNLIVTQVRPKNFVGPDRREKKSKHTEDDEYDGPNRRITHLN